MVTVFVVDSKGNIALVKRRTDSISSKGDKADFHLAHNSKDIAKAEIFTWAVAPRDSLLGQVRPESGWVIYFSFLFSFTEDPWHFIKITKLSLTTRLQGRLILLPGKTRERMMERLVGDGRPRTGPVSPRALSPVP